MNRPEDRPEFAFLASCCRWNFAAEERPRPEIPRRLNWPRFVTLSRFHRVQGLAWNALGRDAGLPESLAAMLAADARTIAATNLAIARECAELRSAFEQAGLPLLFVKGLAVAALAYRNPMLKMSWDIDILVAPTDLRPAADILSRRGFSIRVPERLDRLLSWHAHRKESVWDRDDGLNVELHARLMENPTLLPGFSVRSPAQEVEIAPGILLPTLAGDELFAYLCVHGASSAWFRLKWITDFAALVAGAEPAEIERLYRRSQELGAARAAAQALLLADRIHGTLGDAPALKARLQKDPRSRLLTAIALRQLAGRAEPAEPTGQAFGTAAIHYSQLLLRKGLRFKAGELVRQFRAALTRH